MSNGQTLLTKFKRFRATWRMLLLHPKDFVKQTAEEKRKLYWRCDALLGFTLLAGNYAVALITWALMWSYDPNQPMDVKHLFASSTFATVPSIISVGIATFLFYSILHNWLNHKWAVKTSTPFNRIYNEILYINSPLILLNSIVFFFSALLAEKVSALYISSLDNEPPDMASNIGLVLFGIIFMFVLVGPVLCVTIYYYSTLLAALFQIKRRRAMLLSIFVTIVVSVPTAFYRSWADYILPGHLSNVEVEAVNTMHSIETLAIGLSKTLKRQLSIEDLKKFISPLPENSLWRMVNNNDVSRVLKLDNNNIAGGYRFYSEPGKHGAYLYAVPAKYGGQTTFSFVADMNDWRMCGSNQRGGPATFTDNPVVQHRFDK